MVPDHFALQMSALPMLMVIIGGGGTLWGPALGAVAIVLVEHYSSVYLQSRWPLILGGLFVLCVMFVKGGFSRYLCERLGEGALRRRRARPHPSRSAGKEAEPVSILRGDNICKSFGGLKVLNGVTFSAEPGEKLALIGPNGAGKSTLINVIGGQLSATGGSVYLGEKDITHLAPNKRLHLGMGRSYQVNNLFFHLSVTRQPDAGSLWRAAPPICRMWRPLEKRKGLPEEAERLLHTVGLWEKRNEPLHTLSYGDQRLVELLTAFTSKPKVVLLDEPSAGLPTAEAAVFADVIRKLAGDDTTLIFCAHDMDLVFNLADSIMVLFFGQIIARGLPAEISADPKVREIYLGNEEESC